jgi:hypothetical protein
MMLTSAFGGKQTGSAYHLNSAQLQQVTSTSEYQYLSTNSPNLIKIVGSGNNQIVIVDTNEL